MTRHDTDDVLHNIDTVLATDPVVSPDAMRSAPVQEHPFGPVIHRHTRSDLIRTGELRPVPRDLLDNARIGTPVALTSAVWEDCVAWTDADNTRKGTCQDETGRLWDVLWMLAQAMRRNPAQNQLTYQILRVRRDGRGVKPRLVNLRAVLGCGDNGEPVITVMQEGED